jgi:hypothetical protein
MSNISRNTLVAGSILALTLLGFFKFPGHTYLQSDTQIYVPMLEHFWDPAVLQHDFMVQRPHMAFTIYDEATLALRRLTGLGLEGVLTAQQLLFRALGLLGVFLIAGSLKLGTRMSLLVAGIYGLGAAIGGPTVLTIEFEPVPRGFALPLLLLAAGLLAHGRDLAAGVAASLAFLYHPSTTLAFWAVYFGLACWPAGFAAMRRRVLGLVPLLIAVLLLLLASRHQTGVTESPVFLVRLAPWWEQLLRMRATYVWVSLWFPRWFWHYAFLWLVALVAYWRLRRDVSPDLRPFLIGLPLLGALSVPASYLMLEVGKLALAPQLQVARNVLFVALIAGILASAAGIKAAQAGRQAEGVLWFVAAFALPPVHSAGAAGDPAGCRSVLRRSRPIDEPSMERARLGCPVAGALLPVSGHRRDRELTRAAQSGSGRTIRLGALFHRKGGRLPVSGCRKGSLPGYLPGPCVEGGLRGLEGRGAGELPPQRGPGMVEAMAGPRGAQVQAG